MGGKGLVKIILWQSLMLMRWRTFG